jgi:hypothetical protein
MTATDRWPELPLTEADIRSEVRPRAPFHRTTELPCRPSPHRPALARGGVEA